MPIYPDKLLPSINPLSETPKPIFQLPKLMACGDITQKPQQPLIPLTDKEITRKKEVLESYIKIQQSVKHIDIALVGVDAIEEVLHDLEALNDLAKQHKAKYSRTELYEEYKKLKEQIDTIVKESTIDGDINIIASDAMYRDNTSISYTSSSDYQLAIDFSSAYADGVTISGLKATTSGLRLDDLNYSKVVYSGNFTSIGKDIDWAQEKLKRIEDILIYNKKTLDRYKRFYERVMEVLEE